MREIWPKLAAGERPADVMAECATSGAKQSFALLAERVSRPDRALILLIAPASKFIRRERDHGKSHMRVLEPAKFGALTAIDTGVLGGELQLVLLPGDQVHFARQTGDPEAMNDVGGLQLQLHR